MPRHNTNEMYIRSLKRKLKIVLREKMYVEQVKLSCTANGSKIGATILKNSVVFTEVKYRHTFGPPKFTP